MKTAIGLVVAALALIAYRSFLRRAQKSRGMDPDAVVSIVQRHRWLQWYLVALMLVIAGVIYATTTGTIEPTSAQQLGIFIGGFVLLGIPIIIASRRD